MSEETLQNEAEHVENNLVESINDEDEEILEDGEIDDDSSSDEKVANVSIDSKSVGDYSVFDSTERNPLYTDLELIKKHNRRKHKKKRPEGVSGDEKKSKHRKRKHEDHSDQHSTSPSQKKKKKKKKHNRAKKHRDSSSSSDMNTVKYTNIDEKKSRKYSKRSIPNEDYNSFKDQDNNNFPRDSFNKEECESSTSDSCYSDFETHVKQFQNYTPTNTSDKKDNSTKSVTNISDEDDENFYGYDSNQHRSIRSPSSKFSDRITRRGISRKSPNKNEFTQICRFFREGNCNKADKCTFLHQILPEDSKKNELCSKYLTGKCNGENECNYLHSDYPCQSFFLNSICYNEPNCLFSHEPLTEGTGMLIRKWKDAVKGIKYTNHLSKLPRPIRGRGLLPTPTIDELLNGGKHNLPKIGSGPSNMPILSGPGIKSLMELAVEPSQTLQEKIETNSVICLKPDQEADDEDETSITAPDAEDPVTPYPGYQGSRPPFMAQSYINSNEIAHTTSWHATEYEHMSWHPSESSGIDMAGEVDPFTIEATDVSYTPRNDLVNGNVATKRQIPGETEDEPTKKLMKNDFSNLETTNDNVFANHASKSIWMPPENSYYAAKSLSSPSPAQKIMDLVSKKAESADCTKSDESFFSKLSFDQTSSAQTGVYSSSTSSKTLETSHEIRNGSSPTVKRVSRPYTPVQPIRRQLSVSELNKEPLIIPLHDKQPEELRSDPRISEGRLYLSPLFIFTAKLPHYSFDEVPSTPSDLNKISRPDPRLLNVQKADPRVKARPNDPRLRNRANTAGSVDRMGTTTTNGLHSSESFSKDTKPAPYIPKTPAALLRRPSPIPSLPELIIKDPKPKQTVKSSIPPPLMRKKKTAVFASRSTSLSSLPVSTSSSITSSFTSTDERPSELPIYDPRYVPSSLPSTLRTSDLEEPLITPTPEPPPVLTASVTPPALEHKNKLPQTCDGPPKLFDIRGSKTVVVSSMPKLTRAPPKLKRAPVLKKSV